jgi:hypothetical protein
MNGANRGAWVIVIASVGCEPIGLDPLSVDSTSGGQGGSSGSTSSSTPASSTGSSSASGSAGASPEAWKSMTSPACDAPLALIDPFDVGTVVNGLFGSAISTSGDTTAVGRGANPFQGDKGAVHVYTFDGGAWSSAPQVLTPSDDYATNSEDFGYSVSVSGDTMAIGAPFHTIAAQPLIAFAGAVYIFTRVDGVWAPEGPPIVADDAGPNDHFGASVSLSGPYMVVGAPHDKVNDHGPGAAYLFKRGDGGFQQAQKLPAIGETSPAATFGRSVSISGERIVVGAPRSSLIQHDSGAAFAYEIEHGFAYPRPLPIFKSDLPGGNSLGLSVAVSGSTLAVGESGPEILQTGTVMLFTWDEAKGSWEREVRVDCSASLSRRLRGVVGLTGDTLVLQSTRMDDGLLQGGAHVFRRKNGTWAEVARLGANDGNVNDLFAQSVAVSERATGEAEIWVGAGRSAQNVDRVGAVFRFALTPP